MQSSNFTAIPPNMSRALPIVKSTRPWLRLRTFSRSPRFLPPPAYVTGMLHQRARLSTKSSSMPACRPSTSAAWTRNSEQYGSRSLMHANQAHQYKVRHSMASRYLPALTSISVNVFHLFMATTHLSPCLRQLRSMTSLLLSPSRATSTAFRRSIENFAFGKRYDVTITYWTV